MLANKKTFNRSHGSVATHPILHESLSREEAIRILRSTAEYLEGRSEVAMSAAAEYRLRTLAAKYRPIEENATAPDTD